MFQAVKHICADMAVDAELATAAVVGRGPRLCRWGPRAIRAGRGHRRRSCHDRRSCATPSATSRSMAASASHGSTMVTCCYSRAISLSPPPSTGVPPRLDVARLSLAGVDRSQRIELPPEAEVYRPATRAAADDLAGARRRRCSQEPAHRHRLRAAPLAEALGPRGRRARATRDRRGVRPGRDRQSGLRHHRLGHPHHHPARLAGPGRAVGPAPLEGSRSGASSSASPTPAPTRPESVPGASGWTGAGW